MVLSKQRAHNRKVGYQKGHRRFSPGPALLHTGSMSEDLVRQAELRHRLRPRSGRATAENEDIIVLNTADARSAKTGSLSSLTRSASSNSGKSLPPIRCHGSHENNATQRSTGDLLSLKAEDRGLTPRRRAPSPCNPHTPTTTTRCHCVPLIRCKINNKDVKALLSTGSLVSTVNKHSIDICSLTRLASMTQITIADEKYSVFLSPSDTGMHDIVLGVDFIAEHNCVVDFKNRKLTIDGTIAVPFLSEEEVPLKFRQRQPLTASM